MALSNPAPPRGARRKAPRDADRRGHQHWLDHGRRWREAVHNAALSSKLVADDTPPIVVLGGPANSYTHYITTPEEYAVQRYEGASTLYGPHTLAAYINLTLAHLPALLSAQDTSASQHAGSHPFGSSAAVGPLPPDNSTRSLSFIPGVINDIPEGGLFSHFGDMLHDVSQAYYNRGETDPARQPRATFAAANPRNNLRLEGTYAAVERLVGGETGIPGVADDGRDDSSLTGEGEEEKWETVLTDADWYLIFRWSRKNELLGTSIAEIHWEVQPETEPGVYRLRYFGDARRAFSDIVPFEGVSGRFKVI